MKVAQWHLWAGGLVLILLGGLWFRPSRKPEPTPHTEHEVSQAPLPTPPHSNIAPAYPAGL